eukprot:1641502-Pleurochrysis_carterae.AAC.2
MHLRVTGLGPLRAAHAHQQPVAFRLSLVAHKIAHPHAEKKERNKGSGLWEWREANAGLRASTRGMKEETGERDRMQVHAIP